MDFDRRLRVAVLRCRSLFRRRAVERELAEELQYHLEQQISANVAAGMSPDAARTAALRAFGGVEYQKDVARDARRTAWVESVVQDLRYAWRKLLASPGFSVPTIGTIALAVGAATAVFSIVYGVLIKPLPYHDPARLVLLATTVRGQPSSSSVLDYIDYRDRTHSFSGASAMDDASLNLTGVGDHAVRVHVGLVSASFFDVLGVRARYGRTFAPGEDEPGAARVVILSSGLFTDRFGADGGIIGRTIDLNGAPYTVIGVMPSWVRIPSGADAWIPLRFTASELQPAQRGAHYLHAIARLAPGVTVEAADREMSQLGANLARAYPNSNAQHGAAALSFHAQVVKQARPALLVLLGAVGFVLLVACANVANLLLSRGSARETEIAVRTALGAGRRRIVRQLVTESLLLSTLGALAGVLLAWWLVRAVVAFGPQGLPRLSDVAVDGHVLLFAALLTLVTGLLFGLAPAVHATRADMGGMLRAAARGSGGRRGARRTRDTFVVLQGAVAVVLLVGAGLFVRSFVNLLRVDPGFRAEHVVTATLDLPVRQYPTDHDDGRFAQRLIDALSSEPGIRDVAIGFGRPLFENHLQFSFDVRGRPPRPQGQDLAAYVRSVSPGYFRLLGIPVEAGRVFTAADRADAPQVMVVNREFVRRFFPDENPLGKHITLGWGRDSAEWGASSHVGGDIVGVVADVADLGPSAESQPWMYVPFDQAPMDELSVLARSDEGDATVVRAIRRAVGRLDNSLAVYGITSMSDVLSDAVSQPRFFTLVLAGFGAVGLFLAAMGIYAVMSYNVSLRRREIGIRVALGASRARVMRSTLARGLVLALIGIPFGLIVAWWLRHFMTAGLYGVDAGDVLTFTVVPLVLVLAAALASFLPARRAARVDPVRSMRVE
ncbi:MAG TPA: ABC transporter permease [Gemmatimonadaceae bacterium]|nr:ABC transporter permease [Gemmatimonadaceae bacterium]